MTVVNRVYITDELLQSLGNVNIPNIDLAHNPMYNSSRDEYNVMYSSFHNNQNVVSITNVCNGITYMGGDPMYWEQGTFSQCPNLVNAPDLSNCSILNAGSHLFWNCSSLVNAPAYPNSVIEMRYHFSQCPNLVNAPVIPNSVTDMEYTFGWCYNLVNAPVIPNSVTSMFGTFTSCWNLVNVSSISNNIKNMDSTFSSCEKIVNAPAIPNSVTSMSQTFYGCFNLVNVPDLSNCTNVTSMYATFKDCRNLVNIPGLPPLLRDINQTFIGCSNLVNVPAIPSSVVNMVLTFENCQNLTSIGELSNNVQDMSMTFRGCNNLSGDIKINSEKVVSAVDCFALTGNNKNVLIPMTMTQSMDYTKWYCWKDITGSLTFYTRDDFNSKVQLNPREWLNCYEVYDENKNYLNSSSLQWNPNAEKYYLSYEQDGNWYYYELYYDSVNNVTIHKVAGDTSFTYDSFVEAGYSTSVRKDGVLLYDINDKGDLAFQVTPSTGNSIYVDGKLISGSKIELPSGVHNYIIVNPNYVTYYGTVNVTRGNMTIVTKDLTQITGHNITINTNVADCEVRFNGESATTVTTTQYTSESMYVESPMDISYSVEKYGYYTEGGVETFNNANIVLNINLESSDIDLSDWNYSTDEVGNVILEDYIGPDVTTLVIPQTRN